MSCQKGSSWDGGWPTCPNISGQYGVSPYISYLRVIPNTNNCEYTGIYSGWGIHKVKMIPKKSNYTNDRLIFLDSQGNKQRIWRNERCLENTDGCGASIIYHTGNPVAGTNSHGLPTGVTSGTRLLGLEWDEPSGAGTKTDDDASSKNIWWHQTKNLWTARPYIQGTYSPGSCKPCSDQNKVMRNCPDISGNYHSAKIRVIPNTNNCEYTGIPWGVHKAVYLPGSTNRKPRLVFLAANNNNQRIWASDRCKHHPDGCGASIIYHTGLPTSQIHSHGLPTGVTRSTRLLGLEWDTSGSRTDVNATSNNVWWNAEKQNSQLIKEIKHSNAFQEKDIKRCVSCPSSGCCPSHSKIKKDSTTNGKWCEIPNCENGNLLCGNHRIGTGCKYNLINGNPCSSCKKGFELVSTPNPQCVACSPTKVQNCVNLTGLWKPPGGEDNEMTYLYQDDCKIKRAWYRGNLLEWGDLINATVEGNRIILNKNLSQLQAYRDNGFGGFGVIKNKRIGNKNHLIIEWDKTRTNRLWESVNPMNGNIPYDFKKNQCQSCSSSYPGIGKKINGSDCNCPSGTSKRKWCPKTTGSWKVVDTNSGRSTGNNYTVTTDHNCKITSNLTWLNRGIIKGKRVVNIYPGDPYNLNTRAKRRIQFDGMPGKPDVGLCAAHTRGNGPFVGTYAPFNDYTQGGLGCGGTLKYVESAPSSGKYHLTLYVDNAGILRRMATDTPYKYPIEDRGTSGTSQVQDQLCSNNECKCPNGVTYNEEKSFTKLSWRGENDKSGHCDLPKGWCNDGDAKPIFCQNHTNKPGWTCETKNTVGFISCDCSNNMDSTGGNKCSLPTVGNTPAPNDYGSWLLSKSNINRLNNMEGIKNAFNSSKIAGNAYCKIPNQCSRNNDTLCAKCKPNYELKDDGKCHSCRPGYSKAGTNTNRCQANACASGYELDNKQCKPCSLGHYKVGMNTNKCSPCPKGTYQPSPAASSCKKCTDLTTSSYQPSPGKQNCLSCSSTKIVSQDGSKCENRQRCTSQQKFINGQCRLMCGLTSSVLKSKGVKQLTVKTNPVPSLNKITNYELENNSVDVSLEDNYFVNVASPGRIGCSNSNGRPNLLISGIKKCTKFAGCEIESTPLKCSRYIKLKSTSSIPSPSINDWVTAVNKHKSNRNNKDYLKLIGERYTQCAKPVPGYTLRDESQINPFSQPNYTIRR